MLFNRSLVSTICLSALLCACSSNTTSNFKYSRGVYQTKVNTIIIDERSNPDGSFVFNDGVKLVTRSVGDFALTVGFDPSTNINRTPFVFVNILNVSGEPKTVLDRSFRISPAFGMQTVGPILSAEMEARFQNEAEGTASREGALAFLTTAAAAAATVYSTTSTTATGSYNNKTFSGSSTSSTRDLGAAVQVGSQQMNNARNSARIARGDATAKYNNYRSVVFKSQTLQPGESQSGYIFFDPITEKYRSGSLDYKITYGGPVAYGENALEIYFTHKKNF